MKKDFLNKAAIFSLLLACLVLAGCGESRAPYAGTYRSAEPLAGKNYAELDLKENGKGTWTLGKSVEFTWMVNDDKLWFYIKGGAILIATPTEGGKILSVDMTGEWHPGCPPQKCVTFVRQKEGG